MTLRLHPKKLIVLGVVGQWNIERTRIREEERTISILSRRVSTVAETQQEILLKLDKFEEYYFDLFHPNLEK
mgnify:CR=1 FL=1